jgi:aminoglycoside/choline kinase family phosphotransferase
MSPPRSEVRAFVERRFPGAHIDRLAGDASYRVFYRVRTADGPNLVLMDYGSAFDGETDDVRLGRVFRRAGLRIADLIECAPRPGCLLLEDLGDRSLEGELASAELGNDRSPPALLVRAVELAADIVTRGTPALLAELGADGPALDAERFRFEMDFFLEYFVGGYCGRQETPTALREQLHALAERAAVTPLRVLCHRDLHSRNLNVLRDGALAMVDIQDARWGPDTYDLASLLRDAYVEIDESWIETLVGRYLDAQPARSADAGFRHRFDVVSAQRMIKALGSFGYLTVVKRMDRYLTAIPRTLKRLERLLPTIPETGALHTALTATGLLRV